jgi:hypothetical protein
VLIRQNAPVFGADAPYLQPGEWQLNVSFRGLRSDKHYRLDERQFEREESRNFVINRQHLLDVTATYAFTPRVSLSVGVPLVKSSWSIPLPLRPAGPRSEQNAAGLGDISVSSRYWLFDPRTRVHHNLAVGLGVKLPTGADDKTDEYPELNGQNPSVKAVDQSIQPGDGGWGLLAEVNGMTRIGRAVVFGSANYLVNPRDTNDTPSIIQGLGVQVAATDRRRFNSVPDQYLARVGVAVPIGKGLGASVAWRMEGLPRYDLLGKSNGFRRPGYEMFVEPGVQYTRGASTLHFLLPIGTYRIRKPDAYTGALGDATFPEYIALVSYSYRFGTRRQAPAPPQLAAPPPASGPPSP